MKTPKTKDMIIGRCNNCRDYFNYRELCNDCELRQEGYALAQKEILKIINELKGTKEDWSANGVIQNCAHVCYKCKIITWALTNEPNIIRCYKCLNKTEFVAFEDMNNKFEVKRISIWNFADKIKERIAKLSNHSSQSDINDSSGKSNKGKSEGKSNKPVNSQSQGEKSLMRKGCGREFEMYPLVFFKCGITDLCPSCKEKKGCGRPMRLEGRTITHRCGDETYICNSCRKSKGEIK